MILAGLECKSCAAHLANPKSGLYQVDCLQCCARLVLSARPDKRKAEVMLAVIARHNGAPPRGEVLQAIRAALTEAV